MMAPQTSSSPIPPLTANAELELLQGLATVRYGTMVAVSDLHLGIGVEAHTRRYSHRENFFADRTFGSFLEAQRAWPSPHLLVLNGDILDFLRIDGTPDDQDVVEWSHALARLGVSKPARELARGISRNEREYGLQTQDYKSLWKLHVIERGHMPFFDALASWIAVGGTVSYIRGNHDPEQYWPLIRRAFRDAIYRHGAKAPDAASRVAFVDDWTRVGNVIFEHGHAYERVTRVDGPPTLGKSHTELNLPQGSLVNRYIINKLEGLAPFLDNMKPITALLLKVARSHPREIFRIARRGSRLLWRALGRRRAQTVLLALAVVLIALTHLLPAIVAIAVLLYLTESHFHDVVVYVTRNAAALRPILSVLGVVLPIAIQLIVPHIGKSNDGPGEDEFSSGTFGKLAGRLPTGATWATVYAVLGHTHAEDAQLLPPVGGAQRTLYLNTGTWIPRWSEDRPDLAGRVIYSFVRFVLDGDAYVHASLCWDDAASAERDALILAPLKP